MTFTVLGPPRTKKTHQRIVRVKGRPIIVSAKTSKSWETSAVLQLQSQYHGYSSIVQPTNCRARVYRDRNHGDAVNFYQAIADALEAAGVVENDRLIRAWDGSRLFVDKVNPRVEITLEPMMEEP